MSVAQMGDLPGLSRSKSIAIAVDSRSHIKRMSMLFKVIDLEDCERK